MELGHVFLRILVDCLHLTVFLELRIQYLRVVELRWQIFHIKDGYWVDVW